MQNILEEIESCKNSNIYTPESLAWILLVGELDKDKSIDLLCSGEGDGKNIHDNLTFLYEILLTLFMEIYHNIEKINCYNNNKSFIMNYSCINEYISIIEDKFNIIDYILHVEEFNDENDENEYHEIMANRYCRVILRNNEKDNNFFEKNNIPNNLNYHMLLYGSNNKIYKKLNEIYSIVIINKKIYKIFFGTHKIK